VWVLLEGKCKKKMWWFRQEIKSSYMISWNLSICYQFFQYRFLLIFFCQKNLIMHSFYSSLFLVLDYLFEVFLADDDDTTTWWKKYMPSHMQSGLQSSADEILSCHAVVTDNRRKWQKMIIDYTNLLAESLADWVTRRGMVSTSQVTEDQIF